MLHIYVKDLAGGLYMVEPNKDVSIAIIKSMIYEIKKEYEFDSQDLFIPGENGPIILENDKKLSDYCLGHESYIYIFIRPVWKKMMEDIMKGRYNLSDFQDKRYERYETLCVAYQHALLTPEEPDSQCMIGLFYREKEPCKAVEWFEKAVEQDHVASSYFLGECYYYGIGVEMNRLYASELLHFPAESGYVFAQLLLADYYKEKNGGIYRDVAKLWLKRAAKNGNREAKKLLKNM